MTTYLLLCHSAPFTRSYTLPKDAQPLTMLSSLRFPMVRRAPSKVASSSSYHLRRRLHQSSCNVINTSHDVLPSRSLASYQRSMSSTDHNHLASFSAKLNFASSQSRHEFSTIAATNTTSKSSGNNPFDKKEKKDDSNIFLDNLGKIFLSSIGLVLLLLLRSTKSNNSRVALREEMEQAALLDPLEIDDLRCANSDFTMDVWNNIVKEIKNEFLSRGVTHVSYPQFLSLVMRVMKDMKGEGFTIQMGHLLDRVVIAELDRQREGADENESSDELSLSFLLASLSLALNSSVADRIRVIYDTMLLGNEMTSEETDDASNVASKEQVEDMIQNLQSTCQLVPDAQIVETNSKVPYQSFRVGTGSELTQRAREGYGGKKGSPGVTRDANGPVTLEDFHAILKSRTVCAWGECYIKKSSRTSTSDR